MTKKQITSVVVGFLLCLGAVPCLGGVHYKATTQTEAAEGRPRVQVTGVEAWISGEKAKITFTQSDNPLAPEGTYMLTQDGGKNLYLVNPKQQTYSIWNLEALLGMAGSLLQGMGGIMNLQFSDPQVEQLADESGGSLLGLPTRHYRYRTTYSLDIKVLGMRQSHDVDVQQDFWTTSKLSDVALGVWLRTEPPRTGDEGLDKLLQAETSKMEGFPLKTVTVTTQRRVHKKKGKTGKESVTRSTMEVTSLSQEAVPDSTFNLPTGYQEVPMAPVGGNEGGNPFKGLLRRDNG